MKKFTSAVLIIALIFSICSLISCKNDNDNSDTKITSQNTGNTDIDNSDIENDSYSHPLTSNWNVGSGIYIIKSYGDDDPYALINYIDNSTLNQVILCNKPDCQHDDENCNAYMPMYPSIIENSENIKSPIFDTDSGCIFQYNEKLYTIDIYGSIVSMDPDGSGHQKIMDLNSKYTITECYLYNGMVYAHAQYWPTFDGSSEQEFTDEDSILTLLEIDLQNKTCKELYSFNNEPETELLGLYDGKAYYCYRSPNQIPSSNTQQAVDAEENGHDVKLYYYDLKTGKQNYIEKTIKSFDMDNIILADNFIYYHNRREKELNRLNLDTGETDVLIADLDGYIDYFWSDTTVYDNKLFFIKNNSLSDAYAEPAKKNETFYVDLENKEVQKVNYSYKNTYSETNNLHGFAAVTDDYYFITGDSTSDNEEGGLIAVLKTDFYNNNFDNIISIE